MQLAASLVEYFVTGTGALLWLAMLLGQGVASDHLLNGGNVVLLVPMLYAFGMAIDFASSVVLKRVIDYIHVRADEGPNLLPDALSETVFVNHASPHLGQALELRSIRDRIARGFLFNLFTTCLVIPFSDTSWLWPYRRRFLLVLIIVLTVVAFGAWWRFERLTWRFKKHPVRAIRGASS